MRDVARRLVVVLLGLGVSMGTSVLVAIHGWGLAPKSWAWILGGSLAGATVSFLIYELAKDPS